MSDDLRAQGEQARLVFPSAIEGTLKGLGLAVTPALKARLLEELGLDVDRLPPAIPVSRWPPFLRLMASLATPGVPEPEAMRQLGLKFIRGWRTTAIGSAASAMLRVVGPTITLTRLDRAFRTSDNFTRAVTEFVGPTEALVTINEVHEWPTYFVGVLEGGLELLGRTGSVTIERATPPGATLRVTWR